MNTPKCLQHTEFKNEMLQKLSAYWALWLLAFYGKLLIIALIRQRFIYVSSQTVKVLIFFDSSRLHLRLAFPISIHVDLLKKTRRPKMAAVLHCSSCFIVWNVQSHWKRKNKNWSRYLSHWVSDDQHERHSLYNSQNFFCDRFQCLQWGVLFPIFLWSELPFNVQL